MYKIKDKVVYKKAGVCEIVDIIDKDFGNGLKQYYVICPCYSSNSSKIMLPVDKEASLRNILSKNEALEIIDNMPNAKDIWIQDSKLRKEKFLEIINAGDLDEICSLIYTIHYKREDFIKNKKMLSMMDKDIFETAEKLVFEELATALNISINDIDNFIDERLNNN